MKIWTGQERDPMRLEDKKIYLIPDNTNKGWSQGSPLADTLRGLI